MDIIFENPVALWFLLSLPLLVITHFITLGMAKYRSMKFANFRAIERVTGKRVTTKNYTLLGIRLLILFFLIFALSGAVMWYTGKSSEFTYVIAIDTSGSMLADDFFPSRFEAAQEAAILFVDSLPFRAKIGVVGFSGTSTVETDIISDKSKIKNIIGDMETSSSGGTDMGEAIITATNLLVGTDTPRSVILITDGQSNVGTDPKTGIDFAKRHSTIIHTIGVGTEEGGRFAGIDLISVLDEGFLKKAAEDTGGRYFKAESKDDLAAAYMEISEFNESRIPIKLQVPLMFLVLFLIFIEWGMINTKFRILP